MALFTRKMFLVLSRACNKEKLGSKEESQLDLPILSSDTLLVAEQT